MKRRPPRVTPTVLCAGGLEPLGRAGLLADVETVRELGGRPVGIASSLTAQGKATFAFHKPTAEILRAQLRALFELTTVQAVKTGVFPGPATFDVFFERFFDAGVPWVVDPVVGTSKGELLSSLRPSDFLRLRAPNVILTPNVVECAWLLGENVPRTVVEATAMGARLQARGFGAVVIKGGHFKGAPDDLVCTREAIHVISGRRLPRRALSRRGTGCRYGAALAVGLARGEPVAGAAALAKRAVERYLRAGLE